MKILITTLNSKYSHTNIAGYYLKNSLKNIDNIEVTVKQFTINDEITNILENIISIKPELICFGCYIWNIEPTLKLITILHLLKRDIKIALGGPEVSYNPNEILEKYPYLTAIMCGEGEVSITKLVQDILNNNLSSKIYCAQVSVNKIPSIANSIIENYDNRVVYFETSRGCPFRCSYCLSCIDKNIKYFDLENSKQELKKLLDLNVKQIRFIDRTFNSDRKRALELWKFLINNRKDTTFHFEICANLIDNETLEFLKTVPKDTFQFEIGIQSTNKDTLTAINRMYHFDKEKVILKQLQEMGNIKLHTDLIIGLPFETFNIFKNSFNNLYMLHPTEIQLGFLKLLKGTDIYNKISDYNYKFNTFAPYEVLENNFISYEEIRYLKKFETIFENLYNSGYFKYTLQTLEPLYNSYYELYEDITNYFITNNLFDRKISIDEIFLQLNNLYMSKLKDENNLYKIINQALTYDYFLKFNGKKDWFYTANISNIKDMINSYISENRDKFFNSKNNHYIYKEYKFIILDYNFNKNTESKNHLYFCKK